MDSPPACDSQEGVDGKLKSNLEWPEKFDFARVFLAVSQPSGKTTGNEMGKNLAFTSCGHCDLFIFCFAC